MKHILLLEDDDSLGSTLSERLTKEGYAVAWAKTLVEAERVRYSQDFDLAVLDVGLAEGSGFEFAKGLRQDTAIPFLFITAMASAEYRLQGYELGAEEYIPKPFHLKELLLRVEHVLEKHGTAPVVRVGDHTVNFSKMCVSSQDGRVEYLAKKDCQILKLLVENTPNVVSRDHILEKIWGSDKFPSNRTIDNAILRLRQILGDEESNFIRTVRGVGYQFVKEK